MDMSTHFIYKITNKINWKMYIGRSVNPIARFAKHIKIAETYSEDSCQFQAIHRSIKKYGKINFLFEIIDSCNENEIRDREIYWIQKLNTQNKSFGYNLTSGGDGVVNPSIDSINKRIIKLRGKKHSQEHNNKISQAHKGKTLSQDTKDKISKSNSGINNGMYDRTHSIETRKKMKAAQSNRIRSSLTEEHRQKNREAAKNQDHSFRIDQSIKDQIIIMYASGKYTKRYLAELFNLKYNSVVKIIRAHKIT